MTGGTQVAYWTFTFTVLRLAGNDNLNWLTNVDGRQRLRIDLEDFEGNKAYAEYDNFRVGSETSKYMILSLGKYSGNAGQYIYIYTTYPGKRTYSLP